MARLQRAECTFSHLIGISCFYDEHASFYDDIQHSTPHEKRYILYAKSLEKRVLMIGFTVRKHKIRIITARPASRKERVLYEKTLH